MRGCILWLIFLFISSLSFASQQEIVVNDSTIKIFLEIFPQYKKIMSEYVNLPENKMDVDATYTYKKKIDSLLGKYNMSLDEFSLLASRVSVGYTIVSLRRAGIEVDEDKFSLKLSPEELAVIEEHFLSIKEIMEEK